jgi:hypothetical protein
VTDFTVERGFYEVSARKVIASSDNEIMNKYIRIILLRNCQFLLSIHFEIINSLNEFNMKYY